MSVEIVLNHPVLGSVYKELIVSYLVRNIHCNNLEEFKALITKLKKLESSLPTEDLTILRLFYLGGTGWIHGSLTEEELIDTADYSMEDIQELAEGFFQADGVFNVDMTYISGMVEINGDNFDEMVDILRTTEIDMLVNVDNIQEKIKIKKEEKMKDNNTTEETRTESTDTVKKSNKWWLVGGVVVVAALAAGAVYVYNKFEEKDIIIIDSSDI